MNSQSSLIEIEANTVEPQFACPECGENHVDNLVWDDDDYVRCQICGMVYDPDEATY